MNKEDIFTVLGFIVILGGGILAFPDGTITVVKILICAIAVVIGLIFFAIADHYRKDTYTSSDYHW